MTPSPKAPRPDRRWPPPRVAPWRRPPSAAPPSRSPSPCPKRSTGPRGRSRPATATGSVAAGPWTS